MKPSIELFKLIKSLTKSEKRFFKLTSSLQAGDKNYLKIFDFIDGQSEYDEEALKIQFKEEVFIKHLPSEKNHLYKLILKSLRSFYSEDSLSSIIKQELKNIEILYNKALFRECEKFVLKAKRLCIDGEKFYYQTEVIGWEKRLKEEALERGVFSNDLSLLMEEEREVLEKLRNYAEYQVLYSKINHIFRTGGFTRTEEEEKLVEEVADYHLIKGKNTALSVRASAMCYYIKGLCAATNNNYQDSYSFFKKTRSIIDNNPVIKSDLTQCYIMTLTHLLRCYIDSHNYSEAEMLIKDIRGLSSQKGFNNINSEVKIVTQSTLLELIMFQRKGDFDGSMNVVQQINHLTQRYNEIISKEQYVSFCYYSAVSHFAQEDYKKALNLINEVLNDNEQNLRQDIYNFARMMNLIIHYELENYDFIDYVIKSLNRYLNKQERKQETEFLLIKAIRKLAKNPSAVEKQHIFEDLKLKLEELFANKHERVVMEYFDLLAWVNAKLNKTSYKEEVYASQTRLI